MYAAVRVRLPVKALPRPDQRLLSGPAARFAARRTNWMTAPKAKPQTRNPMKPQTLLWKPRYSHSGTDSTIVTVGRMSVLRSCAPSVLRQASSGQTAIMARTTTPSGRATRS